MDVIRLLGGSVPRSCRVFYNGRSKIVELEGTDAQAQTRFLIYVSGQTQSIWWEGAICSFLRIYIIMTSTVLEKSYEYTWKSHLNISQFRLSSNQSIITTDGLSLALARVATVTLSTARLQSTPEWLPGALFIHNTLHNNIIQAVHWKV